MKMIEHVEKNHRGHKNEKMVCLWLRRLNIVKISIICKLTKAVLIVSVISIKIPMIIFIEIEKMLKFIWTCEQYSKAKVIFRRKKHGGITYLILKHITKLQQLNSMVLP